MGWAGAGCYELLGSKFEILWWLFYTQFGVITHKFTILTIGEPSTLMHKLYSQLASIKYNLLIT